VSMSTVDERPVGPATIIAGHLRAFYSQPIGWVALIVTSAAFTYGGGSVMFWFHAIHRGENGPPINDVAHWLLDSTLGFIALTPLLFFLLPGALYALRRSARRGSRNKAVAYVVLVGVLFGVATGPGPLLHNRLVGACAPLGRLVAEMLPSDPLVSARNAMAMEHSALSEGLLQVIVGVPVYIVAGLLAMAAVRVISGWRPRPAARGGSGPSRP
jgi:hypothetical protein